MRKRDAVERLLAKAEAKFRADDRIPVYVKNPRDLEKRIDELIALGEIAEADRPRCVFYLDYKHETEWLKDDEESRRLNAQADKKLPTTPSE